MERLTVDVHMTPQQIQEALTEDVRRGLTADQKYLLPKYFYDTHGSDLFERITELPEYYPTRAETELLASIAGGFMAQIQPQELVELGSGSSSKTRLLLDAGAGGLRRYIPLDVSADMVRATAEGLLQDYSSLSVHGVIGDFERHLRHLPPAIGRRLVLFLGSTLGNLDGAARLDLLRQIRRLLDPGDRLLLGVDLVKEVSVLEAAYNDSQGVTAAFNRNILLVVNRALYADFQPESFRHHAFYNREAARIEMHLVPDALQAIRIEGLGLTVTVRPQESIWTESSYKFTRQSVEAMLGEAGLPLERWYTDPDARFGLALAAPV